MNPAQPSATHPQAPSAHAPQSGERKEAEAPDMLEYGAAKDGIRQSSNRRLFMQLHVFTGCADVRRLAGPIAASKLESVLYLDVNDPRGIGLLFMGEDPKIFTGQVRALLTSREFLKLTPKSDYTMIGRTYSTGFEQDLEDWLLRKPRRNVFNESLEWSVWYPLRRKGEFENLPKDEQRKTLMEHAMLGMSYGKAELAHDVRLACHGLDAKDNEFVLGIVAHELAPISKLVQEMRRTQQTSRYIQAMGPFFVGRAYQRFSPSIKA